MVGTGGVFTDLLADVTFRMLPVKRRDIVDMLGELKGRALLQGCRGFAPVHLKALTDVILDIARFAWEIAPFFESADFNPVVATPDGAYVVDAKIVLAAEECPTRSASSRPARNTSPGSSTRRASRWWARRPAAGKIGNVIVDSLVNYEFKGRVYPVNPNRDEIMGVKCYPSLRPLPEAPELVVMVVDLADGPDLMRELASNGRSQHAHSVRRGQGAGRGARGRSSSR